MGMAPIVSHVQRGDLAVLSIPSTQVIEKALVSYAEVPRVEWVVDWPGQAVLCVSQKYWTAFVHEAIRGGQKVIDAVHPL